MFFLSVFLTIVIFEDGSTSDLVSQTYLFVDDVIGQDYQATLDAGFPSRWGTLASDYGMDPDIVNDPQYETRLKVSLLSIPSFSIVMDVDDLFLSTDSEYGSHTNKKTASHEMNNQ